MAAALLLILLAWPAPQASPQPPAPPAADVADRQFTETVEVVAVTPIHGLGVPRLKVPANVQIFTTPPPPALAPPDVARLLSERAVSVHLNNSQTGTFQPDLLFRGFAGSPLLGSSEGLAVYQDGVRINEAFGDTINWDSLPAAAVAGVNVMPGSNPLFGLNTLGGAISIRMKDGFAHPGRQGSFRAGSFGRYDVEAEAGGHGTAFGYYAAASLSTEQGWRDYSPSTTRRLFTDLAWRGVASQVHVTLTGASNDLTANGPAPLGLLAQDRRAVFTYPDRTDNDLAMATVKGLHRTPYGQLDTVAYYRHSQVRTLNGDAADGDDDNAGEEGFDALNNRSHTRAHSAGATGQLARRTPLWHRDNVLIVGGGVDAAVTRFDFGSEWATLTADRGTAGSGEFDEDSFVDLHSRATTLSAFATNIWSPGAKVAVTASARFNWTDSALRDQIGTALDGDHSFGRLNPAAGITYQASSRLNLYGSYTESSRVPTPVELTCADPEDPCRLPNAFVSDPPLDQIVARTWEAGARGGAGPLAWSVSAYRTAATDDIIFVSSGTLRGEGHFENIDSTVRRGVEASLAYDAADRLSAFVTYTRQRATFGTGLVIASRFHPLASGDEIAVAAGSALPGVPAHSAKLGVAGRVTSRLHLGFTMRAQSGQYLRGDEANLLTPIPGFAVVDAHARHRITRRVAAVVQVLNVTGADYYTFGLLGDASLLGEAFGRDRFYSPAAPRAAWVGLEVDF